MRTALVLTALLLAGTASADVYEPPAHEHYTLDNGLQVVLVPMPHPGDMVSVHVVYQVGSRDEQPGQEQLAHLTEHVMFRGSESAPDFQEELRRLGGSYNASTAPDFTHYRATIQPQHLERVLWMEADRMGALPPALREIDVALEREIVRSEGRWRTDGWLGWQLDLGWRSAAYPEGHPYHRDIDAEYGALSGFTREDVVAFWTEHYGPERAVLVVSGPIDPASTKELVSAQFGGIPRRSAPRPSAAPLPTPGGRGTMTLDQRWSSASMSWFLPPDLEALPALALYATLPASQARIPVDEIDDQHEREWFFSADLGLFRSELAAAFSLRVWFDPVVEPAEIEEAVRSWWDGRCQEPRDEETLAVVRLLYASQTLAGAESPSAVAGRLGEHYAKVAPRGLRDWSAAVQATTGETLCAAVKEHLPSSTAHVFVAEARISSEQVVPTGLEPGGNDLYDDEERASRRVNGPPAGAPRAAILGAVEHFVHRSGARVYTLADPSQPQIHTRVLIDGAPLAEGVDTRGLSHLAAVAVARSKGGGKAATRLRELEEWGLGIDTGYDDQGVWMQWSAAPDELESSLADVKAMLRAPDFAAASGRRWGLRRSVRDTDEQVSDFAWARLRRAVMRKHPSQGAPFGSGWSLQEIKKKEMRAHYDKWFRPEDMVIFFSGDLDRARAAAAVDQLLGKARGTSSPAWIPPVAAPPGQPEILLIHREGGQQTQLIYGSVAPPAGDERVLPTQIAASILGGGRLRSVLRSVLGSTYGVHAIYRPLPASGLFTIETSVDRGATIDAVRLILTEVDGARRYLAASDEELATAKALLEGRLRAMLGDHRGRITAMQGLLHDGFDPADVQGWIEAVRGVTVEDVKKAVHTIADIQAMTLVVVGPEDLLEEPLKAFGYPVRVIRP